ncbi:twin-arginine translocase TatA/TatE family subunit [Rhodospirillum centenum]|uniref:Sec-independent protein translocase protein TatA n=1 Tax=Rhodospirillum centenum (strain ATCC 51521 / SW) TaxID=414684 RepID=B6ISJ9_RHOCS|nr:twin-arginine translocase TatA/TatE family subunit [Rhodospirillum centenum]ACI98435.1 Sec-independent protein translocase protein TatA [Rhodospirillum centenum SW]
MGGFSWLHWVVVLGVVLVVFGAGKLPRAMGDLAKGMKAFKRELSKDDETLPGPSQTPPQA